jgi:mycothiol synthase
MRADPQETLTPDQARAVLALAVSDTGPQPALSEQTLLVLRRVLDHGSATEGVRHLLGYDERAPEVLVAYAQLVGDEEGGSAELLVHPEHRRRGHGTALVVSLLEAAPRVRVWAHGDGEAARGLAGRLGLVTVRDLWQMSRPLSGDGSELPEARLPEGFAARTFEVGADEERWLAVNATAFASHPEQGRVDRRDLDARIAETWFDASGFILVDDRRDTHVEGAAALPLAAFHWTKVVPGEDSGEVYVVGVDPAYQGLGLGRAVTVLGLEHLRDRGLSEATLYVDGDNEAAVATYGKLGFHRTTVDVMYARPVHPAVGA